MRKLATITAALALTFGAVAMAAPQIARAAASCPSEFGGEWLGSWNIGGSTGTIDGKITYQGDHSSGTLTLNTGNTGQWEGDTACDQVTGEYTGDPQAGDTSFVATLTPDGKELSGTFHSQFVGDGTFDLIISADSLSLEVGGAQVVEGGSSQGALSSFALTSSSAAIKASQERTATVSVTLAQPAPSGVKVVYRFDDGTATRGIDYVDNGQTHTMTIGKGKVQRDVSVKTLANTAKQSDRTFYLDIVSVSGGFNALNSRGTITIQDDDR